MKKKNILMVVENSFPHDVRVRKEANVLKEHYEVFVISLKRKKDEKLMEFHNGVHIYRIPELPDLDMGKLRYILEYLYFTIAAGIIFLFTHPVNRYKVLHVHNPPDTLFLVGLLAKLLFVKFVYDHHDLSPELYLTRFSGRKDLIYKVLVFAEKMSCRLADVVISNNDSYKKIELARHGIREDKIAVVRNDPIIAECTTSSLNASLEPGKKKLLFLGAINPQDGVDMLLHAVRYLVYELQRTDFVCDVLGSGDSLEQLKIQAHELGLNGFVRFRGLVLERNEVKNYIAQADIGIEPAPANPLNNHSTFVKVMEYMAGGKPVVAFDLEETRYSIGGGGLLLPSGDIPQFAKAIDRLLSEPALREELGNKGLERVSHELTWEKASISLLNAYSTFALNKPGGWPKAATTR